MKETDTECQVCEPQFSVQLVSWVLHLTRSLRGGNPWIHRFGPDFPSQPRVHLRRWREGTETVRWYRLRPTRYFLLYCINYSETFRLRWSGHVRPSGPQLQCGHQPGRPKTKCEEERRNGIYQHQNRKKNRRGLQEKQLGRQVCK